MKKDFDDIVEWLREAIFVFCVFILPVILVIALCVFIDFKVIDSDLPDIVKWYILK